MRVFVTGASGFIGSSVTRDLLDAGHSVLALALPADDLWRLRDIERDVPVVRGALADPAILRNAIGGWAPEVCIHLAWYAEPGKYLDSPANVEALSSSLALLRVLSEIGCRRMVAAGTCAEYDTDRGYLREDDPARPLTLYAAAKLSCGLLGSLMAQACGMRFAWARIFYPYGPYEDQRRVIPGIIRSLLSGQPFPATAGDQVRDYVHVADVASAFRLLAEKEASGVFNIASGVPVTMKQVLGTVGNLLGCPELVGFGALPYRDWEPMFVCGDSQRLRALGWLPRYGLDEGLSRTIDWWRSFDAIGG